MRKSDRRKHVLDLAEELGVDLRIEDIDWCEGTCGEAYIDGSRAWAVLSHEPGESLEAYLVALHELGHMAMDGRGKQGWRKEWPRPMLRAEARAWTWALAYSREAGPKVWKIIHKHLRSYETAAYTDGRIRWCRSFEDLLKMTEASY